LFAIGMELIITTLILDPEHNDDGAGKTEGQPGYIYEGVYLISLKIPPGYFQIVLDHGLYFIRRGCRFFPAKKMPEI
jgi:hypothetical protein